MKRFFNQFIPNQQGVAAIEYALLTFGVVSIGLIVFHAGYGGALFDFLNAGFNTLQTKLTALILTC